MASHSKNVHVFKAAAIATTAFSNERAAVAAAPEPSKKKRKRSRPKEQISLELFKGLSDEEMRAPHELAAEGNLEELKALMETFGITTKEIDENGDTLLHCATRTNQIAVMQYLIDSGARVNDVDKDGNTSLHVAVQNDHIEAMHLLLNSGAKDKILNKKGEAPLHIAFRNNNTELIAAFLEHPVELVISGYRKRTPLHVIAECDNVEACEVLHNSILLKDVFKQSGGFRLCAGDEDNVTPIHLAARMGSHRVLDFMMAKCRAHGYPTEAILAILDEENSTPLHAAVDGGHTEVVKVLLKHGANPTDAKGDQLPPVHLACSQGKLEMLVTMVKEKGKEILQCRDQYGQTPLHRSTHPINSAQIIAYLVQQGVELDVVDDHGRTPLHYAIISGSLPAVQDLLSNGANPTLRDHQGYNSLHLAVVRRRKAIISCLLEVPTASQLVTEINDKGDCAFHHALKLGFSDVVQLLIPSIALQLQNCKDGDGNNYLHLAAKGGNWKALSALLDIPASQLLLNETNKYGATPLHLAAGAGHLRITEMLLNQGAMVHKCHSGMTPFLNACGSGQAECAKACFEAHTFQKDWTDDKGNTALHLAVKSGNPAAVTVALDVGVAVTLNFAQESFFDLIIQKVDTKCAMAVVTHPRWQECLDTVSPNRPHPMIGLIVQMPEVAKKVLNHCHIKALLDREHPEYWEKFRFKYLQLNSELSESQETDSSEAESQDTQPLLQKDEIQSPVIKYKASWNKPPPPPPRCRKKVPPLEALRTMVKYNRVSLLTHPVVEAYIKSKWRDYGRWVYLVGMIFFLVQTVLLTGFVLAAVDVANSTNATATSASDNGSTPNITNTTSNKPDAVVNTLRSWTLIFAIVNLVQYVLVIWSMGQQVLNFVENIFVWIHSAAIIATIFAAIPANGPNSMIVEAAALASFFSWFAVFLDIQLFDLFGVYVTMFLSITRTVFQVLLLSSLLIIAFGLAFHVLAGNVLLFSTFSYSFFINFGHLLGEIDYAAFVNQSSRGILEYDALTFIFVIVLAILMAIVIQNLLIGLAVGDIETIRLNAIIEKRSLEVGVFTRLDSNMPKRILRHFERASYTSFPNKRVSSIRKMWRFFWRSIKGKDPTAQENTTHTTGGDLEQQNRELVQIKERLEELTLTQEKILNMIREMHAVAHSQPIQTDTSAD